MLNRAAKLPLEQKKSFFISTEECPHWPLIEKQMAMIKYQQKYTPGYTGALLSTYRVFPFRMEELFSAVGRHTRPVLIIW